MCETTSSRLVAYADGQLDPEEVAAVEAYIAANPEAAKLVEEFRKVRAQIEGVVGGVANQPAPQRLIDTIMTSPLAGTPPPAAEVVPFPIEKVAARSRSRPVLGYAAAAAIAAVLATGATLAWQTVAGGVTLGGNTVAGLMIAQDRDGRLVAAGALHDQLEKASSVQSNARAPGAGAQIRSTFAIPSGAFCREFEAAGDGDISTLAVACRSASGAWKVEAMQAGKTRRSKDDGVYRPVGASNPDWDAVIDRLKPSDQLDEVAESALIKNRWQRSK